MPSWRINIKRMFSSCFWLDHNIRYFINFRFDIKLITRTVYEGASLNKEHQKYKNFQNELKNSYDFMWNMTIYIDSIGF